ncbi:MAG: general secretion pathway protein GspL, partial [Geobacteraceae bacterium]|nr:general secretion pathway protein GspL [Geobacteraceae bacterium]
MFITVIHKKTDEFVIARFQGRGRGLQFVRGARHLLKDEDTDVDAILAAWSVECQGDRVVLLLPPSALFLRELELPIVDRKRCREILPLELKGELASDADEPVYEALPLSGGRVAAIWAKQSMLLEEIKFLAERGFEPEAISCAMFNWQSLLPESGAAAVALTDGESVAIYQDGKPLFFRGLSRGDERALDATIAAVELAKGVTVGKVYP